MLNTNLIYNEAGTGAPDFPNGMPTVGGDPIVESGSNSDGEWTRWADGTQQHVTIGSTGTADSKGFTHPMPYLDTAYSVSPLLQSLSLATITAKYGNKTTTAVELAFVTVGSSGGSSFLNSNIDLTIHASGRWK